MLLYFCSPIASAIWPVLTFKNSFWFSVAVCLIDFILLLSLESLFSFWWISKKPWILFLFMLWRAFSSHYQNDTCPPYFIFSFVFTHLGKGRIYLNSAFVNKQRDPVIFSWVHCWKCKIRKYFCQKFWSWLLLCNWSPKPKQEHLLCSHNK